MTLGAAIGELGWGYVLIGVVVFVVVIVGALRWIASYAPAEPVNRSTPEPAPRPPLGTGAAYWLGSVIGAFRAGLHDAFYDNSDGDDQADDLLAPASAATPQNDRKAFAITSTDGNDPLLLAKVQTLAACIRTKKIGKIEGIQEVFGLRPSGTNPEYQLISALLQKELTLTAPGARVLEPDGSRVPLSYPITGRA